jgi:hypothetical protein
VQTVSCEKENFAKLCPSSASLSVVAHVWKERLTTFGAANFARREVLMVRVASFTFRFGTTLDH